MEQVPRELYLPTFHIDTNRINSRNGLESMNKLENWAERGLISLMLSEVAQQEAQAGKDPRRLTKASEFIYSETLAHAAEEKSQLNEIEVIVFPSGAKNQNQRNDVEIAFNAKKYCATLITADGDLLTCRTKLLRLGINVMTDFEAVAWVERSIAQRDEHATRIAGMLGVPPPDWVGND